MSALRCRVFVCVSVEDNADELNVPQFKIMAQSFRRTDKIDMMVKVAVRGKPEFDRTGLNTASTVLFYLAKQSSNA